MTFEMVSQLGDNLDYTYIVKGSLLGETVVLTSRWYVIDCFDEAIKPF